MAYAQAGNLPFMQLASVTGIWGIVFVTTWFGSLASWAAIVGPMAPGVLASAATSAIFGLLMLGGSIRLLRGELDKSAIRVAAIEPTGQRIDQGQLMAMLATAQSATGDRVELRRSLTALHDLLLATSEREMTAGATVIVWPKATARSSRRMRRPCSSVARAQARAHGAYLLMGIVTLHAGPPFRLENKAILIEPSGELAFAYRKARPSRAGRPRSGSAGDGRIPVHSHAIGRFAAAICFDLDFPGLLRQAGLGRADLVLAPASDWPAIGRIHHAMASFRAVENGFSLVRAARWGVSGVVDPYGRTLSITDHRSPGAAAVARDGRWPARLRPRRRALGAGCAGTTGVAVPGRCGPAASV